MKDLERFLKISVRVIIDMMMLCNDFIVEYDRRRSGLPNAPLDMEYDNSSIEITEIQTSKHLEI